jgi:membrane protein YdbS with pleckstrin-like domain
MPFPRRLLIEGEELVLDLRPHWIALVGPGIAAVVGLAAAVWVAVAVGDSAEWIPWVVYLVLLVVYPLPKVVWWLTSNFAVTSDRVIHREGFIAKRSMEIPLEAINDVRFDQGVVDRMIGAGTLVIQSASEHGRQMFDDIRDPEGVQRTIYHEGEKNKQRMYQGGPGVPAAPSVTTELERLADLRAKGILTEEEFQAQKARILGQR